MDKITVDGQEFTKADVVALRNEVIKWRDESFKFWPFSVEGTLTTTYLIGFLAGVLDQYPPEMTTDEFLEKFGHTPTKKEK